MAAVAIGGLLGTGVDKLPVSLLARGILAMVLAWNMSLLVVTLGWRFVSPMVGDAGILPVAPREVLITSLIAAAAGGLIYFVLARKNLDLSMGLFSRTITLGVLGSLAGSVHGLIARGTEEFEDA